MNSYRYLLYIVCIAALIILPARAQATAAFPDMGPGWEWADEAVHGLVDIGVISGFPDGRFGPSERVTRGQFIRMLVSICQLPVDESPGTVFADMAHHWTGPFVNAAVTAGIIDPNFYGRQFHPDQDISRSEMARLIVRTMRDPDSLDLDIENGSATFDDLASLSPEDLAYIQIATDEGIIAGYPDGSFRPDSTATRAEAAVMLHRMALGEPEPCAADLQVIPGINPGAVQIGDHWMVLLEHNHFIAISAEPGTADNHITIGLDAALISIVEPGPFDEQTLSEFIYASPEDLPDYVSVQYPDGLYVISYSLGERMSHHLHAPEDLTGMGAAVHKLARLYPERVEAGLSSYWGLQLDEGHWIFWTRATAGSDAPSLLMAFSAGQVEFIASDEMLPGIALFVEPDAFISDSDEFNTGAYVIFDDAG